MSTADLLALAPLLVLAVAAIVVMLAAAFWRSHALAAGVTAIALALSLASLPLAARLAPRAVTPLLSIDTFALIYIGLLCACALAVTLLAYDYLRRRDGPREELYVLLLTATLGGGVLAASTHFAALFLGLELLSVSLFVLIAYPIARRRSLEAGIKYLVLSAMASALLVFGIALLYFDAGALDFQSIGLASLQFATDPFLLAGFAFVLTGLGFKLSLVPFHLWAPDVYEGAPAPITAFLATLSKGAVAVVLLRYLGQTQAHAHPAIVASLQVVALLSIVVGNLLALLQDNLKRILAYSSIAHLGYLLIAFVVGGAFGEETATYYLAAYFVMTLGAFAVIARLSTDPAADDVGALSDYRGLFWRRPWPAGVLTAMLLALAGIPLTVGFVAKFYLFVAGIDGDRWALVAALVAGSVIGLFYYLRVVAALFATAPASPRVPEFAGGAGATATHIVLATLLVLLIGLGIFPQPAMELVRLAATMMP